MKEISNEIKNDIYSQLINTEYLREEEMEKKLSQMVGEKARCYDDYIDEGIDDEDVEDEYIYCGAFEFENTNLIVRVYYGNVTGEITHISCN